MSVINTNIKSLMAQDSLTINNRSLTQSMQRLSTGLKINSAADDAAGLGISTRMDAQVRGLNMAIKNANDTISMVQTAEGAMQEVTSILQRMRELAVQSASDTNGSVDRAYLQAEVSQLSSEIDRISNTTQWNSMNILDGSYRNKLFQIGANQGQTLGLSIGSMNSKVLGVASSQPGAVVNSTPAAEISGAVAQGVQADQTVVRLKFEASDTYTFTLADGVSGLAAAGVTAKALDLNSANSRQDFIDELNLNLKKAAVDTSVKGSATLATFDLTDPDNYNNVKFTISVDGGTPAKSIDLRSRLLATGAVTATSVAASDVATAMQTELQAAFDSSITVTQAAGVFTVTDALGRTIEISQGAGNGAIFGTDAANDGPLTIDATLQTNLSAAWDGNDIVVTNSAGGKTTIAGYTTSGSSKVMFDTVTDTEAGQDYDPVALVKADTSAATQTFSAKVEPSQISMVFSDLTGDGTNAKYEFKLTDGAGHVYADLTGANALEVINTPTTTTSAATIEAAVKTRITAGLSSLSDESIDLTDFKVSFNNNTLSITNAEGVALAVEDFKSSAGYLTVTPNNELGATTVMASQNAYYSQASWAVNSAHLGATVDLSAATDVGKYDIYIDGMTSDGGTTVDLTLDGSDNASLSALATALQTAIRGITDVKIGGSDAVQDLTKVTVTADTDTNTLLIRDSQGRRITLTAATTNTMPEAVFQNPGVSTTANDGHVVKVDSAIAQGDTYAATQVTMSLNMTKADFDFSLNGMFLADATTTAAAATVTWDSTQPFAGSTMQTKLDALMVKLNSAHGSNVFEYSVSGNNITFYQRDGGPIEIGEFETGTGYDGLKATLTPAQGQGEVGVMQLYKTKATAYAQGTAATATAAVLQLTGDDVISLSISDGTNSYSLGPTSVDVGDLDSARVVANKLNDVLGGSSIRASMDSDGNISFTDATGGTIALTSFNSTRGLSATWSPEAGQGDDVAISGSYSGSGSSYVAPNVSVGGGTTAVSQISVLSQDGASKAMSVIDSALTYVNAERAKLGAVENRLTHTIDNLTNIVTNTQASKSRITDTDYAQETSKLARAQIIQQAATAMLAQANQQPQTVLALLK